MSLRVAALDTSERPIVELHDIACGYEGRPVLERLALSLYPGQFAGIVGPSGSGKTTVLRAILGQAQHRAQHGSLAGAARPDDPGELAGIDRQRQPLQHRPAVVAAGDVVKLDEGSLRGVQTRGPGRRSHCHRSDSYC